MNAERTETTKCEICSNSTDKPLARYCAQHRAEARRKHRKYFHTEQSDSLIRAAYPTRWSDRAAIRRVAQRLGWPRYAVVKRACELGIAKTKEKPWSEAEISILEAAPWMSEERLRLRLSRAGFKRSRVAIHLKMKRLRLKAGIDGYSLNQLAEAFGIDGYMVRRWIKAGWLNGTRRGTDRTPAQGGDTWYFPHSSVYSFVMKHPDEVDLTKVEKFWFLDLVTKGAICR